MDKELDLVIFEDDDGNELKMEVLDYLKYEGKEYALLTEYDENADEDDPAVDAYVMEVVPIKGDEEYEEFVPVDEKLSDKLIEIFQTNMDEMGEEAEFIDDLDDEE